MLQNSLAKREQMRSTAGFSVMNTEQSLTTILRPRIRPRLIGNGAIPHDAQNEVRPDDGCTPLNYVNTGTWGSGNAISSFVMLTVDGPTITVEYIDQDGNSSSIPKEVWTAKTERQPLP